MRRRAVMWLCVLCVRMCVVWCAYDGAAVCGVWLWRGCVWYVAVAWRAAGCGVCCGGCVLCGLCLCVRVVWRVAVCGAWLCACCPCRVCMTMRCAIQHQACYARRVARFAWMHASASFRNISKTRNINKTVGFSHVDAWRMCSFCEFQKQN